MFGVVITSNIRIVKLTCEDLHNLIGREIATVRKDYKSSVLHPCKPRTAALFA
jgi:hypothetical protein